MTKLEALATHLKITLEAGETLEDYLSEESDTLFSDGNEYIVATDDEADAIAYEYIANSVWAFNAEFLADYTGLPSEVFTALQDKCEGANDTFTELIENCGAGMDDFVSAAISADGRGHFMNSYDGHEYEVGEFFIYFMG